MLGPLPSAVGDADHEAESLPALVDRAALVVDEAALEAEPLHRLEVEVRLRPRALLRPRDPQPAVGGEAALQRREAASESRPARREQDGDVDGAAPAGGDAEQLRESV